MTASRELIRVIVELEPASDPIRGSVRAGDAVERAFDGWIQLTAALEDARAALASPPPLGGDRAGMRTVEN